MSTYGLIKATSRAIREDTIEDLNRINRFLIAKGEGAIQVYGPSVRALENSVALGLWKNDIEGLPELLRGVNFYWSILIEIKEKERHKFLWLNDTKYRDRVRASKNNGA